MKSPELRELEAEQSEQLEPSLDKMVDLSNPKVLEGLGRLAKRLQEEEKKLLASPARTEEPNRPETEAQREPAKMKGRFPTAQEYAEHLEGRPLSPEEMQPVNTYTARGPTGQ